MIIKNKKPFVCFTLDTLRSLAPARAAARPDKALFSSLVGEGVKSPEGRGGAGGGRGAGGGAWLERGGGGPGGGGGPVGVSVGGRGGGGGGGAAETEIPRVVGVTVEPGGRGGGGGGVGTAWTDSVEGKKKVSALGSGKHVSK